MEIAVGEIFAEINPIEDYTGQKLELRFKDYHFDDPKMTEQEARENNISFEAPLKAVVELTNKVTGEVKEQEIYLGDYPWMTDRGTFVINGAERVVVNQLIRSAGVFFTADLSSGRNHYGAKLKQLPAGRCTSKLTAAAKSRSPRSCAPWLTQPTRPSKICSLTSTPVRSNTSTPRSTKTRPKAPMKR